MLRQTREHLQKRSRPARGGADGHDPYALTLNVRWSQVGHTRMPGRTPPTDMGDHLHPGKDLHGADDLPPDSFEIGPVLRLRLLDDLEGAGRERVEGAPHPLTVHG